MYRRKQLVFFLICLLGMQIEINTNLFSKSLSEIITTKRTISLGAIGAAAFGIYKFGPQIYNSIQDKINDEIHEEMMKSLVIMLTPNCFIHQLNDADRNIKFQKKAWLISGRKRILSRLEELLSDSQNKLSIAHKKQLKLTINKAKVIFDSVGFMDSGMSFLIKNPYEHDSKEPGYFDQIIENRIYESIIFSSKPVNECTPNEKLRKIQSKQNMKRIIMKKLENINGALLTQIEQVVDLLFS